MTSNSLILVYLASNILRVFCFFLFLEAALPVSRFKSRVLGYMTFFALNSVIYLVFAIPLANIMVNIIGLFLLTFFYPTSAKQRIISVIFIFAVSVFSEEIILVLTHYTSFSMIEAKYFDSMIGIICVPLVLFIFVIFYRRWSEKKRSIQIPFSYTLSILVIPLTFILVTLLLFSYAAIPDWLLAVIMTALFIVTIGAYFLYDRQIAFFQNQNDLRILEAQNRYYRTQLDIIRENNETIKRIEHDLKNHLLTIQSLSDKENSIKAHDYIDHLKNDLFQIDQRFDTDNPVIDGILNMKASAAKENGTPIHADLQLPANCSLDDFDATILLGNILDNAIENSSGDISLTIRYSKGRLFITCSNSFSGERKRSGNVFLSTKDNPSIHGFGYKNMLRVAEKYEGSIVCDDADGVFKISVMLMLPSKP